MKSKKAMIFEFITFFMILILLTMAFFTLYKKQNQFPEEYWIGERQFGLINTYQEGEKALFYVDQSAKYSAYPAIYELGQKGGYEAGDCGDYFGYSLWVTLEGGEVKECYPEEEDIKNNFGYIFNKNLDEYLVKYTDVMLPLNNYQVILNNKFDIIGKAETPIIVPIVSEKEDFGKRIITYQPSSAEIDVYLESIGSPLSGIGQCIEDTEKLTEIPAMVIVGVAIHESGYGKSGLSQKSKNLFGIKCSEVYVSDICTFSDKRNCCKVWDKTALDLKYEPNSPNAYRVYQNWCESINDFANIISSNERYKEAMQFTDEPALMVSKIREAGYATDPNWARGIIDIMQIAQNKFLTTKTEIIT